MPSVDERIRGILQGRRGDTAWLYDEFSERLHRRLGSRYRDLEPEEVEDILHECYVLFFKDNGRVLRRFLERHRHPGPTPEQLERYLWDRACGLAVNLRRRVSRSLESGGEPRRSLASARNEESHLLNRDMLDQLGRCLQEGRQQVHLYYQLRYWEGLTPVEIEQVTGWRRKGIYRLRDALQRALKRCVERLGLRPDKVPR
ncbi:MAG: sigma-70 family RNA polymerase sigma factor [Acidobacteriota bacterium]